MNFFAHYYFSSKQDCNWYNAGLLLPDFLRIFTHRQQLLKIEKTHFENNNFIELKNGIKRHLADDKVFHNWDWFVKKDKEILIKLRKSELGFKRDWVLSHIFIELAIDSYLAGIYIEKIDQLYNDLQKCSENEWEIIFDKCGLNGYSNWIERLNKFLKIKYIYKYKDTSAIIYSLNRIYESTGIGKFDEKQNEYLLLLLKEILPEVKIKITELRKILK